MKIVHEVPPFLDAILNAGMAPRLEYALFAYGDTLFIPGGFTPSPEVLKHEELHGIRQMQCVGGPDAWWERYLDDQYFRIAEEAEAYACQYECFCGKHRDRNLRARYLHDMSAQLASPLYGRVISAQDARRLILKS